jgi:2-oxoglutarate ferredoxin oxidoreductase subunit beta
VINDLPPIDTCALAIQLGATYVARSFSGDKRQLLALIKGAIAHNGTSMLDVISPCVTFNDHEGSTKSYSYVKDHDEPVADVSFIPFFEDISIDYDPGTTTSITLHDGSQVLLRKITTDYDPTNKGAALQMLTESHDKGEIVTGLFYVDPKRANFIDQLNVLDEPLATLPESKVRPPKEVLDQVMQSLM